MESAYWGSPLFTAESAASAETYISRMFPVRYHSNSRINVSSEVDTKGKGINIWKTYSCICVGRRQTCNVKFMYKYTMDKEYQVFQSEGEHAILNLGQKRKLTECSDGFQNALVAMVSSGSQSGNIVDFMRHTSLVQRSIFPNEMYAVISAEFNQQ